MSGRRGIGSLVCASLWAFAVHACGDGAPDAFLEERSDGASPPTVPNTFTVEIGVLDDDDAFVAFAEHAQPIEGDGSPFQLEVALRMPRAVPGWLMAEAHIGFAQPGSDHAYRAPRVNCPVVGDHRLCADFQVPLYHQADFLERQERLTLVVDMWSDDWRGTGTATVPIWLEASDG